MPVLNESFSFQSIGNEWMGNRRNEFEREIRDFNRKLALTSLTLMLIGVISNSLVCMVVIRARRARQRTLANVFILNLSIADIMFRVVYLITRLIAPKMHWKISMFECKVMLYCHYACAAVTFALLAGIAIDRYQHIMHPLKYINLKKSRSFLIVLSFWLYAVVVSIGFIIEGRDRPYRFTLKAPWGRKKFNQTIFPQTYYKTMSKRCVLERGALSSQLAFTPYFVLAFLVPLVVLTVSYTAVFRRLSQRSRHNISKTTATSKRKALNMLIVVVLSFIISWAPIMMLDLLRAYDTSSREPPKHYAYRPITEALSHTSSILNPVIYAFGNANFRKEMRNLFRSSVCLKRFARYYKTH